MVSVLSLAKEDPRSEMGLSLRLAANEYSNICEWKSRYALVDLLVMQ